MKFVYVLLALAVTPLLHARETDRKSFKTNGIRIVKKSPCEMTEIRLYNNGKAIPMGRLSMSEAPRPDHTALAPLVDDDITTRAPWETLTIAATLHCQWKDWGHRIQFSLAQEVTDVVIATPDASTLKGSSLSLLAGPWSYPCTIALDTVAEAGKSGIFKINFATGKVDKLPAFPDTFAPYKNLQVKDYIEGDMITFDQKEDLKTVKAECQKKNNHWDVSDGAAHIVRGPRMPHAMGTMTLPWTLKPGQTVAVEFDHEYRMWCTNTFTEVRLGKSVFKMDQTVAMYCPDGNAYCAAQWTGLGYIKYTMFITRGEGENKGMVSWAVAGLGYDRKGTSRLKEEDASKDDLPVQVYVSRKARWVWFNYYNMEKDNAEIGKFLGGKPWEVRVDKGSINTVAIGKLKKALPECTVANPYWIPTSKSSDLRGWFSKAVKDTSLNLPKLDKNPLDKRGPITDDEFNKAKAWFLAMPLPKSNLNHELAWQYLPRAGMVHKLLSVKHDRALVDMLVAWCDSMYEYRNGGPHLKDPMFLGGKAYEPIPGWPAYHVKNVVNGKFYSNALGLEPWAIYSYLIEHVAKHPEIYNLKVRRGQDAGKLTYLEKSKALLKEIYELTPWILKFKGRSGSYELSVPWNQQTGYIVGYHNVRMALDSFDKNGISYLPYYREVAEGVPEAFLDTFFDAARFHVYRIDHKNSIDAAVFYYDADETPKRVEDIGHANSEMGALAVLYESGIYKDKFLKPRYVEILANTFKYALYKGDDEKTGDMLFAHGLNMNAGIPESGPWRNLHHTFFWPYMHRDKEFYKKLVYAKYRKAKLPMQFNTYIEALIYRQHLAD